MNKKAKRLAMKSILSLKAQNATMKVVEDFSIESGKTKDLSSLLSGFLPGDKAERTVVILKDDDAMVKRAGRNIPWLHFLSFNRLRAHDLFYGRTVIVMESAVKSLNEFYADK
jgi:large subunit ribosomal protein L4